MNTRSKTGVLFVCLGNICRSPMAEGVFRHLIERKGLAGRFVIESAGTSSWHAGEPAHPGAIRAAKTMGFDITGHHARKVVADDFERFHYLLAMDQTNLRHLQGTAPDPAAPTLDLLLNYTDAGINEVPDPYYAAEDGFRECLDLITRGAEGFLEFVLDPRNRRSGA